MKDIEKCKRCESNPCSGSTCFYRPAKVCPNCDYSIDKEIENDQLIVEYHCTLIPGKDGKVCTSTDETYPVCPLGLFNKKKNIF